MRNFRTAAVATATAFAVAFGGAAAATAAEGSSSNNQGTEASSSSNQGNSFDAVIFEGKQVGDGTWPNAENKDDKWYLTDSVGKEVVPNNVPDWARWWTDGIIVAAIGSLVGLVIAGINFASYNGWINL